MPQRAKFAYKRALELARSVVTGKPQDAFARAFVAYLQVRLGQTAQGQSELEQSLRISGRDADVLRVAVMMYEALGDREGTLAVLKDAPETLIRDMSRQPDMTDLARDARFKNLLASRN